MEIIDREVDFKKYCATCKYKELSEKETPCDECLANPVKAYSDKPVRWVEKEKTTK
jgi:hypothetical protein